MTSGAAAVHIILAGRYPPAGSAVPSGRGRTGRRTGERVVSVP
ncbi:hypothetical protein M2266_004522 [Streptomyces sp. SPB162]|nr:hypothetical protein [Streptomyces sp. SPB162]